MKKNRLPREIWAAGISLKGLWPAKTISQRMDDIINRIGEVISFQPDIICLPETVNISWVDEENTIQQVAEDEHTHGPTTALLAEVAKKNNCYITSPVITKSDGKFYDSSILIGRKGEIAGVFHKVHPTSTEILPGKYFKGGGVTPGPIDANVFDTDFGKVGLQVCADADWSDGWEALKVNGAEVVCFSSQGPYTNAIRNRAWLNRYFIVSATGEDAQIVDITGDVIAVDNQMTHWVCAPVNLEKTIVRASGNLEALKHLQKKYGPSIRVKVYAEENWATVENMEPDVRVSDVLRQFSILTFEEEMSQTNKLIKKLRN